MFYVKDVNLCQPCIKILENFEASRKHTTKRRCVIHPVKHSCDCDVCEKRTTIMDLLLIRTFCPHNNILLTRRSAYNKNWILKCADCDKEFTEVE